MRTVGIMDTCYASTEERHQGLRRAVTYARYLLLELVGRSVRRRFDPSAGLVSLAVYEGAAWRLAEPGEVDKLGAPVRTSLLRCQPQFGFLLRAYPSANS